MGIIKSQSAFIIRCWRKTFCDSTMCLPICIFCIPPTMENMQCLYWGQGFREAFAWQIIKWSYNLQLQHIFNLLCSDASEIEVWRTWCRWVNWPRETTALQGFNQCRLPWICTCTQCKLTVRQLAISTRARCTSWPIMSFRMESERTAWHEPVTSLNSRTKVGGGEVWDPDQLLHLRNRGVGDPGYLFHTCEHANTARIWQTAAAFQVGSEKWLPAIAVKQIHSSTALPNLALDPARSSTQHWQMWAPWWAVCLFELQIIRHKWAVQNKTAQRLVSTCSVG